MGGAVEDPADLIAERDAVQRTVAQLPETLRLCLVLSVVGGLPSHHIARVLGLGEAAVRQRLSRGTLKGKVQSWAELARAVNAILEKSDGQA